MTFCNRQDWGYSGDCPPGGGNGGDCAYNQHCSPQMHGLFCRGNDMPGDAGNIKTNMASIIDGTSNTLMIGETVVKESHIQWWATTWTTEGYRIGWAGENCGYTHSTTVIPINYKTDYNNQDWCAFPERNILNWGVSWGFKSKHPGGANFAFADGSVHFIPENIEHRLFQQLGARDDEKAVQLPF
jgi:prepilin-type processing-associated H-X9-DG protein